MISFIRGQLLEKSAPSLLIDVQGLGYEVLTPMTTFYDLPDVGASVQLHTYFVVREDAQILYGFADKLSKQVFTILIKVNGVGPKLALAVLSGMDAVELYRCVQDNDIARLVKLPGVGKKTAERLVIEVRDKLDKLFANNTDATAVVLTAKNSVANMQQDAISALLALGYKESEASKVVRSLKDEDIANSEALIRLALQRMVS